MQSNTMMSKTNWGALSLALLFFFDSTAYGLIRARENATKPVAMNIVPVESASVLASHNLPEVLALPVPDGGPDQPEVKGFTPIGVSDMVDPFTGDFSYNIPLLDVDGYPINIAYSSGVTMDQEASWVGLGWNLNPGVVNRAMRGIPDDFNGTDKITKEFNVAPNWTIGGTIGGDIEIFGFGDVIPGSVTDVNTDGENSIPLSLNASMGIQYNNYNGFSSTFSLGLGISFVNGSVDDNTTYSGGLGLSGNSQGGASLSPSFSISSTKKGNNSDQITKGLNLGSNFNSRGGLSNATVSAFRSRTFEKEISRTIGGETKSMKFDKTKKLSISSSYNFGASTYTPQISLPFKSGGGTFSFKLGSDVVGTDWSATLSGYYNKQWLAYKSKEVAAYGYMNLATGQGNENAMLDFNRENDGAFTKNTPALPIPNVTYDVFSISGQGVSGSYRPVRRDIGYVFDPSIKNNSVNGSLGLEVNLGGTFKGGIDVAATYSNSSSGPYNNGANEMATILKYNDNNFYFREANELAVDADPNHYAKIGGNTPLHFNVVSHRKIKGKLMNNPNSTFASYSNYSKSGQDKRNQVVSTLSIDELKKGYGVEDLHPDSRAYTTPNNIGHHIGQFSTLNVDGTRYIYGIAAYSHEQKNVSFAIDNIVLSCSGLAGYVPGADNSVNNDNGVDNYYNAVTTKDYAHSYLLTGVLNADYVDADNIKGPSKGDLGGYLSFDYEKIDNYKWRNPVNQSRASYDEGFNTDKTDDKAHYIYGKKELWYVKTIESKNHIAVFHFSDRNDGFGVNDENGGVNTNGPSMQKLDSIQLFSLPAYEASPSTAVPLKTVHFEYDYSLCPSYDQNVIGGAEGTGKLTLKKVFFTYQWSNKGRYSPYVFEYGFNPEYNTKAIDRWNNYKEVPSCGDISVEPLRPSDFPYVGFDQTNSDLWSSAWLMNKIHLPSGGRIEVDYESDDYAYVQHKRAQNMLKIVGVENVDSPGDANAFTDGTCLLGKDGYENAKIYFELMPDPDNPGALNENVGDYVKKGELIYFRAMLRFASGSFDFVPGYAKVVNEPTLAVIGGDKYGCIQLSPDKLLDNCSNAFNPMAAPENCTEIYNPIAVAGIQFARLHLAKFIPPSSNTTVDEGANLPSLAESIGGAFESLQEIFVGPNLPLWNANVGKSIVLDHSWIRLTNPNKKKLGGGVRVKSIRMFDSFDEMTNQTMGGFSYGQEYNYTLEDGTSSGVASYEPELGNDENPWRQPKANNTSILLAPDVRNYQETPFGEQFFPSARVGYSRVTISNLKHNNVNRNATGKVVHEFYTAKDFPTIVKRTQVDYKRLKIPVFALFFSSMIDEMAASQGFVVENNDMHGKPKRQSVFGEGQNEPITKVEYNYLSEPMTFDGVAARHLVNTVSTISKNGSVNTSTIGLTYEAFADFRESKSNTVSGSVNGNLNTILPFVFVPIVTGSGSYERTAFRSATFTKVIERFGLQSSTVASDLGSVVETKNLAYDAETGTVLVTQTTTNFNDAVYNFTYPAHWHYDQMGQAYKNLGLTRTNLNFVNGGAGISNNPFVKGDELAITVTGSPVQFGWVVESTSSGIKVLLKDGTALHGPVALVKVIRSGRRNLQTTPIGTIALRTNPLPQIGGNIFDKVLQAGAVEYSDDWRTFCECFLDEENDNYTTNPYVLGTRGTWRPKASYVHLSDRTQTFVNENSNIREDGVFSSFTPFYNLNAGSWGIDKQNWTYTSSVVEFSPFGQALETIDALNRYSSSMFGYNQTLPIAVAANTRYRELGYDGFEDYDFINCSDNHFKLGANAEIVDNVSHTGRKSIKVSAGNPVVYSTVFEESCDDAPCMNIETQLSYDANGNIASATVSVSGGLAPYQFDYETLSGNATSNLEGNTLTLINNDLKQGFHIVVTVTDANGCTEIIEIP